MNRNRNIISIQYKFRQNRVRIPFQLFIELMHKQLFLPPTRFSSQPYQHSTSQTMLIWNFIF